MDKKMKKNMEGSDDVEDQGEYSLASLTLGERLGKVSPSSLPKRLASRCMECRNKFSVIKRKHRCHACGKILCSKCCGMKSSLEYLQNQERRVCATCFHTLAKGSSEVQKSPMQGELSKDTESPKDWTTVLDNPETISKLFLKVTKKPDRAVTAPGSPEVKKYLSQGMSMSSKDIQPQQDWMHDSAAISKMFLKVSKKSVIAETEPEYSSSSLSIKLPPMDPENQSFIIKKSLPPVCTINRGETTYEEDMPITTIMEKLRDPNLPPLQFAINRNLSASVKIVTLDCCTRETCWVISTRGMECVGQDEIMVLLTLSGEKDDQLPKEIFLQFHHIYQVAAMGNTVNELEYWCVKESPFLGSKQHGGFLFIRPTFQCLDRIDIPPPPFLVGVLILKSEIPWAKVFPFRLMLRLGAQFECYPCPLVSIRFREPVYYEIVHTLITDLLPDFRTPTHTMPRVEGLKIHMESNQSSILIPRNRYNQVIRILNNSNNPIFALAGNFSPEADSHLVCVQSKESLVTYRTRVMSYSNKPRKVTGASFVALNGDSKFVSARSILLEDGLMVEVPSKMMTKFKAKLRNMENWSVRCEAVEGENTEWLVKVIWCEDDKNFNVGVKSVIDNMPLDGVPSIRVHRGENYTGHKKFIRWTQVFIIKSEEGATSTETEDSLEVIKLSSENIARATCLALAEQLEPLAESGLTILGLRVTLDRGNVAFEAGSNGEKLAPIYMKNLENELPAILTAASANGCVAVLELIFHIMNK